MTEIYSLLSGAVRWLGLIVELLGILAVILPQSRKALTKFIRKLSGYSELQKHNEEVNKKMEGYSNQLNDLSNKLDSHMSLDELKMNGLMNGLKDSLLSSFHFYEDRGYITLEELKVLQDIYEAYTNLGGNGLIKSRWENVICKLPSKPKTNNK